MKRWCQSERGCTLSQDKKITEQNRGTRVRRDQCCCQAETRCKTAMGPGIRQRNREQMIAIEQERGQKTERSALFGKRTGEGSQISRARSGKENARAR